MSAQTSLPSSSIDFAHLSEQPSTSQAENLSSISAQQSYQPNYGDKQQYIQNVYLPTIQELPSLDLQYLMEVKEEMDSTLKIVTGIINDMKNKRNPTQNYLDNLAEYEKYKQTVVAYQKEFMKHSKSEKQKKQVEVFTTITF